MRTRLLQELKDIYANQSKYVPSDCQYLMPSYHEHSKKLYSSISSWLAFHRPIFKNSRVLATRRALQRTRPLPTYYPSNKPHQDPRPSTKYHYVPHPALKRTPMFPCNKPTWRLDRIFTVKSRPNTLLQPDKENQTQLPNHPARRFKQTTIFTTNHHFIPNG